MGADLLSVELELDKSVFECLRGKEFEAIGVSHFCGGQAGGKCFSKTGELWAPVLFTDAG